MLDNGSYFQRVHILWLDAIEELFQVQVLAQKGPKST